MPFANIDKSKYVSIPLLFRSKTSCPIELYNTIRLSSEVKIFPNPASTKLKIESDYPINQLEISDLNGKIIVKKSFYPTKEILENIAHLKSGIYITSLQGNQ